MAQKPKGEIRRSQLITTYGIGSIVAVEDKRAESVIDWVRRNGGKCTARELCRNEVAGIKKSTEAKRMLQDLEDRGLGHCTVVKAGKKESVTFVTGAVVG